MSDVMPSNLLLGGRGGVTKTGAAVYSETDSDQDKFMKSLGKSKIEVNPDVEIGVYSGGKKVPNGNLH